MNAGNGLHIIQITEIQPPFPFLAFPSSPTSVSVHRNQKLEDVIEKCRSYSKINLGGENVTNNDIQLIVNQAMNKKQCTKHSLENNKTSPEGVSIIASGDLIVESLIEMFKQNQLLKAVNISNGSLSDNGKTKLREAVTSKNGFKLDL